MQTENFDVFFSDFGSVVQAGGVTTRGILDMPSEIIAGGMVISTDYQLTFKSGALTLSHGQVITVDGTQYRVREARFKDDGALTEAFLSKL